MAFKYIYCIHKKKRILFIVLLILAVFFLVCGCSSKKKRKVDVKKDIKHVVEKFGYIDTKGNIVIPPIYDDAYDFHEGLAPLHDGHKWGYINKEGKIAIKPVFKEVNNYSEELAWVKMENFPYYCCIDKTGKIVFKFNRKVDVINEFSEGFSVVVFDDDYDESFSKFNYISKTGKLISQIDFIRASSFSNGIAIVKDEKGWAVINKSFKIISRPDIDYCFIDEGEIFSDGQILIGWGTANRGYVNDTGKININLECSRALAFHEGLAAVQMNGDYYMSGKWGYIDNTGKMMLKPIYYQVKGFHEGLAAVKDIKSKKYGYINKKGKLVIPYRFKRAGDFSCGLALVRFDGYWDWKYIDKNGKVVIDFPHSNPPTKTDLNLNCYSKQFSEGRAIFSIGRIKDTYGEAKKREIADDSEEGFIYED